MVQDVRLIAVTAVYLVVITVEVALLLLSYFFSSAAVVAHHYLVVHQVAVVELVTVAVAIQTVVAHLVVALARAHAAVDVAAN